MYVYLEFNFQGGKGDVTKYLSHKEALGWARAVSPGLGDPSRDPLLRAPPGSPGTEVEDALADVFGWLLSPREMHTLFFLN